MSRVQGELELALVIKAADRLVNMQASLSNHNVRLIQVYKQEYPIFKKAVYRDNLCDEIWEQLEFYSNKLLQYNFYKPLGHH